ncbi:MAG: tRNA (N(6)-L-threonylcarbamoyladenosine(37)-C(2))-methylthiotransferase MtaB [Bacilli bacterium]|nr:tRNA (N(6)-L-threonylcarbamoyladenosine(37)-C(2))-methylthiotransferase MtaB [Bacilli bacterium]
MTFNIHTFGCKVNIYESEYITNIMEENGYKLSEENPDIYIINTCTVTNEADKKDRKMINQIRKKYPKSILIVMGCYSQLKYKDIDADIIIGNKYKSKIIDLIKEYKEHKEKIVKVEDITNTNFEDMYINRFINHTRAFVKIQDGCNAFCSYCTIPYARGGLRSKDFNTAIKEVTELVKNGYKEIVLTGIHTGRYGIENNTNLEKLLKEMVKIPNIFRIRLSSIEINEITDGIIELIKNNNIMAKHLHIPLQSGSNKILEKMNRKYDLKFFNKRIEKIKKEIEDISITTDLIVGFPGETEDDFNETINTLKEIKFTKIHTFPYSKREGTEAAKMKEQVDGILKKCRVGKVLSISKEQETDFYKEKIDKVYDGIIETRGNNKKIVLTSNYIPVEVETSKENNEIVKVKILSVDNDSIKGIIIE